MIDVHETDFPAGEAAFQADLGAYAQALADHALTVGEPAPTAHPAVVAAFVAGGFNWVPAPVDPAPVEPTQADLLKDALAQSDKDMARVGEDLVFALEAAGVIARADLPQSAQDKLANREALRAELAALGA
nr:hypothetical protein 13 [Moraxellaceae bacterium]